MSSEPSKPSASPITPKDKDVQRLQSLAAQKETLAEDLKKSPAREDQVEAHTQEIQAEHLSEEAHERAAATGAKPPRKGKLP